jgi:hypothetical protein
MPTRHPESPRVGELNMLVLSISDRGIYLDGFAQSLNQLTEFLTLFAHKYSRARVLQLGGHDEQ